MLPIGQFLDPGLNDLTAAAQKNAGDDRIGWVDVQPGVGGQDELHQVDEIVGVHLAGVKRGGAGDVGEADDRHAVFLDDLTRFGGLAVSTAFGGEIDDHGAPLHPRDDIFGDEFGGGFAGDGGGGDDDIRFDDHAGHEIALFLLLFGGKFLCISTGILSGSGFQRKLDEFRPEALDLLLDGGANIIGATTAPSRRAVAIACKPATPAPMINALTGWIVPAAVISIGKIRGDRSAARMTAL